MREPCLKFLEMENTHMRISVGPKYQFCIRQLLPIQVQEAAIWF